MTFKKTDQEYKSELSPIEFEVTRQSATERPFTGKYWDTWVSGIYKCICCGSDLFDSASKFVAGCGWPSFFSSINGAPIAEVKDFTHGMSRTEIRCKNCDAHLGHVFNDGPKPSGQRYCVNSASLKHTPNK